MNDRCHVWVCSCAVGSHPQGSTQAPEKMRQHQRSNSLNVNARCMRHPPPRAPHCSSPGCRQSPHRPCADSSRGQRQREGAETCWQMPACICRQAYVKMQTGYTQEIVKLACVAGVGESMHTHAATHSAGTRRHTGQAHGRHTEAHGTGTRQAHGGTQTPSRHTDTQQAHGGTHYGGAQSESTSVV